MPRPESTLLARAAARRELTLRRARQDFAEFCRFVFSLELADHHRRWIRAVEEHARVCVVAPIEHGKSTLLSICYPIWLLGRNPNLRIGLVSETHTQAIRPLAAIREAILLNARLKQVFPALQPATGGRAKWSDSEILVERSLAAKDASVIGVGVLGPLLGARLDLAILDDVVGWENSFTAAQRQKVITWFRSTLVGRIVSSGRIIVVGTPWHGEDLLHELESSGEYHVARDPALNETGDPLWPDAWPKERLEQRRREIGAVEFSRQMMLKVLSDTTSRFRMDWFERAFRAASEVRAVLVDEYAGPHRTFCGVDLGVGQDAKHAESVLFTIVLLPDGRRQVIQIESGRWQGPELVARLKATHRRYQCGLRVESNGGQMYLCQFLQSDGIQVEAHHTGANRHHPRWGIESLAIELEQGRWIIPDAPATRAWARELLSFSPTGHAGDRVIASWLAREAARSVEADLLLPPFLLSDRPPPCHPGVVQMPGWLAGQPDSEGDLERDVLSGYVPMSYRIDG